MKEKPKRNLISVPLFPQLKIDGEKFWIEGFESKKVKIEDVKEEGWRSGRGRKYKSGKFLPSFIIGLVDKLRKKKEIDIHSAFRKASRLIGFSPGYIKKIYYSALRRDEYRPIIKELNSGVDEQLSFEDFKKDLEGFISLGGWFPREYLFQQVSQVFGLQKAEKVDQIYGDKLDANFRKFMGEDEDKKLLMRELKKLDPKKERDKIEAYCTLHGLDFEETISELELKNR
jgi:hypothetical protein